jgi:hypothetical protein
MGAPVASEPLRTTLLRGVRKVVSIEILYTHNMLKESNRHNQVNAIRIDDCWPLSINGTFCGVADGYGGDSLYTSLKGGVIRICQ